MNKEGYYDFEGNFVPDEEEFKTPTPIKPWKQVKEHVCNECGERTLVIDFKDSACTCSPQKVAFKEDDDVAEKSNN